MRRITKYILPLLAVLMLGAANSTGATKKYTIVEMADGNTVAFPMTAKEIAAQKAEQAKHAAVRKAAAQSRRNRVDVIEMADDNTVAFPMTAREIAAQNARQLKHSEIHQAAK